MKTAQRLTAAQRDSAVERLRVLTAGATFAGVTATVGFAWLAAWSNPGTQASVASTSGTASTSTAATDDSAGTTSGSSSSLGSTNVGSTSGRSAHATGGGS